MKNKKGTDMDSVLALNNSLYDELSGRMDRLESLVGGVTKKSDIPIINQGLKDGFRIMEESRKEAKRLGIKALKAKVR